MNYQPDMGGNPPYKPKQNPWSTPNPLNPHDYQHISKRLTPPVKTFTIEDLFPQMDRRAVGFESLFETLASISKTKATSYPPCNITKFADGKFEIDLALAGFRKEDISITVEDHTLIVSSEALENGNVAVGEIIHQGIAQRDFKQTFALAEFVEVAGAKMTDGILTIKLITNIPDEKKPKSIDIK